MANQAADRESGEGAILAEAGADHCARGPKGRVGERLLKPRRRQMDDSDRVADQRQSRPHSLECLRPTADGEVAGLPARGGTQLRQVDREPLLQLARAHRCHQGWARRAAADVDQ
jgi:hypothetical protein